MILCIGISIHILILCIRYLIKLFRLHEVRLTVTSVCMLYLSVTHIHTQNITLKKKESKKKRKKEDSRVKTPIIVSDSRHLRVEILLLSGGAFISSGQSHIYVKNIYTQSSLRKSFRQAHPNLS